ncbi:putative cation-transporting ATPase 13A5 [Labeo rohita]|uniref:Cation-transporting ATPase 13A5 n=1 Tax=Labeo rohita TaxID=84645 RepID=A0ABQ8LXI4_LABRO|nr:putative cation-transporting ATPase 13A5 [Labeo rohita]
MESNNQSSAEALLTRTSHAHHSTSSSRPTRLGLASPEPLSFCLFWVPSSHQFHPCQSSLQAMLSPSTPMLHCTLHFRTLHLCSQSPCPCPCPQAPWLHLHYSSRQLVDPTHFPTAEAQRILCLQSTHLASLSRLLFTIQPVLQPCLCWPPSVLQHLQLTPLKCVDLPCVLKSPAPSRVKVPKVLASDSGSFTPPQPVDPPAPPWLLPPLASPRIITFLPPPGFLVPLATPWSIVTSSLPHTSAPSATLSPSIPMSSLHSSFPTSPRHHHSPQAPWFHFHHSSLPSLIISGERWVMGDVVLIGGERTKGHRPDS